MDNCITSLDSESERERFIHESIELCAEAKFKLRGWTGNRGQIVVGHVTGISSSECRLVTGNTTCQNTSNIVSVPGLLWHLREDALSLDVRNIVNSEIGIINKRRILSATHQIYDPIGFCSPVSIVSRIITQDVFKRKLNWDEEVSLKMQKKFLVSFTDAR